MPECPGYCRAVVTIHPKLGSGVTRQPIEKGFLGKVLDSGQTSRSECGSKQDGTIGRGNTSAKCFSSCLPLGFSYPHGSHHDPQTSNDEAQRAGGEISDIPSK